MQESWISVEGRPGYLQKRITYSDHSVYIEGGITPMTPKEFAYQTLGPTRIPGNR